MILKWILTIALTVVIMAAWNVPGLDTMRFWIGAIALAAYGSLEANWK